MPTVYEAAGASAGILKLAQAWHARMIADEVVSHAFSHGYHPDSLAAYSGQLGEESPVVRTHSGHGPTRRWTTGRSSASTRRSRTIPPWSLETGLVV